MEEMKKEESPQTQKKVDIYYSSSKTDQAYKVCWGEGNIHFGYYPHLDDSKAEKITFDKAAEKLTMEMIKVGEIDSKSKVLDMGCGYGKPACDVASNTKAQVWGVDLSGMHINKAEERAKSLKVDGNTHFHKGSFTDLPKAVTDEKATFTHVWSQVAWCHAHAVLEDILAQAYSVLKKGGKLIVNDFLGSDDEVKEETKEHVWKRLKFTTLVGHKKWKEAVEKAGFKIKIYKDLDKHMEYGYAELARTANKHGFKSADGELLGKNYAESSKAGKNGQIGMNLCVAIKE
mmetsp:Transcript_3006/g.4445  ORF Transcript_3006/g.4445 Transcript_3006/m.4445 type:complete len:288 (-) Transcript_3006:208-1071(-)|eukprot:CAMPEP_0167757308 /NCGR_PEP_ID=MMETSP0110_2-20121227/9852_1 /TAXON_ID=629695 /ORGANISM="Gymnochlora sp., Strain CCMP2014" /LENGTH=287 /DNA_ID=CAMNT_0007643481 /DNA_START=34 /DNA_END=897 /DNA_ORIENTATION=+